jgi:hypothetical protein
MDFDRQRSEVDSSLSRALALAFEAGVAERTTRRFISPFLVQRH